MLFRAATPPQVIGRDKDTAGQGDGHSRKCSASSALSGQSGAVPTDDERFRVAVENFIRSGFGGVLVCVPGLALVALGAPQWLTFGYLLVVVVVLTPYVIWQRRRSRRPGA